MQELIIGQNTLTALNTLISEKNKIEAQIHMIVNSYVEASGIDSIGKEVKLDTNKGTITIG